MRCDKCHNEATVHEVLIRGGKKVERHLCEEHAREEGFSTPAINAGGGLGPLISTFLTGLGEKAGDKPEASAHPVKSPSDTGAGVSPGTTPEPDAAESGAGATPMGISIPLGTSGKINLNPSFASGSAGQSGVVGPVDPRRGTIGGRALVCPACGYKYADFRQAGLLGCPECYAAFEAQLSPLLSRAHEGGTHHVGKTPQCAEGNSAGKQREHAGGASSGGVADTSVERAKREARVGALREQLAEAVSKEQYEKAAALRDEIARVQSATPAKHGVMPIAKKMPHPPHPPQGPMQPGAGGEGAAS